MSLLEDTSAPARRPSLQTYVLPGLVLVNLLLLLLLTGVLPAPGDPRDPARAARQIDPERVQVLPADTVTPAASSRSPAAAYNAAQSPAVRPSEIVRPGSIRPGTARQDADRGRPNP